MATSSHPAQSLSSFKVLTFDCYGTLVDWSAGILSALRHMPTDIPELKLLDLFNEIEAELFVAHPTMFYDQLLYNTYDLAVKRLGIDPSSLGAQAGREKIVRNDHWPAFPDSVDALNALQKLHGYKLVVLSNITLEMFDRMMRTALEGVKFDAVYTAEEIGSYKPSQKNFEYLLGKVKDTFGVERAEVLHVAHGLRSDHVTCKQMEINSCWISRGDGEVDARYKEEVGFGWRFDTMKEFLEAVGKEKQ